MYTPCAVRAMLPPTNRPEISNLINQPLAVSARRGGINCQPSLTPKKPTHPSASRIPFYIHIYIPIHTRIYLLYTRRRVCLGKSIRKSSPPSYNIYISIRRRRAVLICAGRRRWRCKWIPQYTWCASGKIWIRVRGSIASALTTTFMVNCEHVCVWLGERRVQLNN